MYYAPVPDLDPELCHAPNPKICYALDPKMCYTPYQDPKMCHAANQKNVVCNKINGSKLVSVHDYFIQIILRVKWSSSLSL